MTLFETISKLLGRAQELDREVPHSVASPRAGQQQRCSVCAVPGHKAPRHAKEIKDLKAAVSALQDEAHAASAEVKIMTDFARQERTEKLEAQTNVRRLQAKLAEANELIRALTERVNKAEALLGPGIYGQATSL